MITRIKNRNAFTLVEMLVVIAIMGILAAMLTYLAPRAARAKKAARMKAEIALLISAIDSYHTTMGFYPPDNGNNPTNAVVSPAAIAPLYYELMGTTFNGTVFTTRANDRITQTDVEFYFGRGGIANSQPGSAQNFFRTIKHEQHRLYRTNSNGSFVEVMVVPMEGPNDFASLDPKNPKPLNTWRYLSGVNATNNPGRFDLWAEIVVGGQTNIIGNWNQ